MTKPKEEHRSAMCKYAEPAFDAKKGKYCYVVSRFAQDHDFCSFWLELEPKQKPGPPSSS